MFSEMKLSAKSISMGKLIGEIIYLLHLLPLWSISVIKSLVNHCFFTVSQLNVQDLMDSAMKRRRILMYLYSYIYVLI